IDPGLPFAAGRRLWSKLACCDWNNFENESAQLAVAVRSGRPSALPFDFLGVSSEEDQLKCARLFVTRNFSSPAKLHSYGDRYRHDRIRIAYVSGDFCDHPVAQLLVGLIEQHDRARFETIAISFGADDKSALRTRLKGAFEHFVDVKEKSDLDVAR